MSFLDRKDVGTDGKQGEAGHGTGYRAVVGQPYELHISADADDDNGSFALDDALSFLLI